MRHLRNYEIFESFESIELNCKKYDIQNYTINSDGSVDVRGNVDLSNRKLTKIPLNFNRVEGDFYCAFNNLQTLEGCPKIVTGGFYCRNNQLSKLDRRPLTVEGDFYCSSNNLITLEGCPNIVRGNLRCLHNKIMTLEWYPKLIEGLLICEGNPFHEIWRNTEGVDISTGFLIDWFNDCDAIRFEDNVWTCHMDRLNIFLDGIGKKPLKHKLKFYKEIYYN